MDIREKMLPVLQPKGGKEEIAALTEVIESGWWGKGPKVAEFEEKFAKMVGHKYAIAVTSASHGQDLEMKARRSDGQSAPRNAQNTRKQISSRDLAT